MSDDLIEAVARAICCNGPCYVVALNERAETAANYEHPWHCPRTQYADKARAAIAAIEAAGYRIVPVVATDAMQGAAWLEYEHSGAMDDVWKAFLDYAPKVIE